VRDNLDCIAELCSYYQHGLYARMQLSRPIWILINSQKKKDMREMDISRVNPRFVWLSRAGYDFPLVLALAWLRWVRPFVPKLTQRTSDQCLFRSILWKFRIFYSTVAVYYIWPWAVSYHFDSKELNLNRNRHTYLRTAYMCMRVIVHNCRTQHNTEQFW